MRQFKTAIKSNEKIKKDHYRLTFSYPKGMENPEPGQFFNIKINNSYKPLLRRPFGTHKIGKNEVKILYKVVGEATRLLSEKKKGEKLDILGPLGNGFPMLQTINHKKQTAILIGGGHGVAPLYALAEKFKTYNLKLIVFIGARTKEHIVCDKDFKKLGAKVNIATEDGSKDHKGLVTDLLKKNLGIKNHKSQNTIYTCGPKLMLKAVAKIAKRYKIPCRLSLEEYMACGIGTCLGCAVKTKMGYKMVCKDGPVFDSEEILW